MSESANQLAAQLADYKRLIDADIAIYGAHVATSTRQQYGDYAADVTDVFLDVLGRGGKRIRGALVMAGYEMCGGTDRQMITRAATAIEMVNAYTLMIDDIQDRSAVRRGKTTGHEMLAAYHRDHNFRGDAGHAGVSLALNAALAGGHAANMLLAGLSVDAELRVKTMGIVSHALIVTAHGQTLDIINELTDVPRREDIEHVLEWKTAFYTFLNPLCVGMVLAGAGCEDTDAIRGYALATGRAFQVVDDIIGIYGNDQQTGKSALDDLREGKQTVLTDHALSHASPEDAAFLRSCLGSKALTATDFERCKQILTDSGARAAAETLVARYVAEAIDSLGQGPGRWKSGQVAFLRGLSQMLLARMS
jgi:geranylgeranyl diphosphate synthase type I